MGQSNFARLVAKYGFTRARLAKGAIEGTVGTALFEPIVYTAAQREQSQYDLVDSFLAVSFGTVLGGGLHVGAGKLKDFRRRRKFEKKVKDAREKAAEMLKNRILNDGVFSLIDKSDVHICPMELEKVKK